MVSAADFLILFPGLDSTNHGLTLLAQKKISACVNTVPRRNTHARKQVLSTGSGKKIEMQNDDSSTTLRFALTTQKFSM